MRSKHVSEKIAIVLSILRGGVSISEASRKHGVGYKTLLAWRDRFQRGEEAAFKGKGPNARVKALGNENKQLNEALAEMALRVEVLKNSAASVSELCGTGSGAP